MHGKVTVVVNVDKISQVNMRVKVTAVVKIGKKIARLTCM